jgi:hypothetical protein
MEEEKLDSKKKKNHEPRSHQLTFGWEHHQRARCLRLAGVRHTLRWPPRDVRLVEAARPPGEHAGRPELPVGRELDEARPEQHGAGARDPQPHPRRRTPRLLGLPASSSSSAAHLIRGTTNVPRRVLGHLNSVVEALAIFRVQSLVLLSRWVYCLAFLYDYLPGRRPFTKKTVCARADVPAWPWEVRTAAAGQGARVKFAPVWMAAQLGLFVRARGLSVCKSREGGLRPCVGRGYEPVRGKRMCGVRMSGEQWIWTRCRKPPV